MSYVTQMYAYMYEGDPQSYLEETHGPPHPQRSVRPAYVYEYVTHIRTCMHEGAYGTYLKEPH